MTSRIATRARIVKLRQVQHALAIARLAQASGNLERVMTNLERLGQLRRELEPSPGPCRGAALAQAGEMAMRIGAHDDRLGEAVRIARAALALRDDERVAAQVAQEGSERLHDRAARDDERRRDAKLAQLPRRALRRWGGGA